MHTRGSVTIITLVLKLSIWSFRMGARFLNILTGSTSRSVLLVLSYFFVRYYVFLLEDSFQYSALTSMNNYLLNLGAPAAYSMKLSYWVFISLFYAAAKNLYYWPVVIPLITASYNRVDIDFVKYLDLPVIGKVHTETMQVFYLAIVAAASYYVFKPHFSQLQSAIIMRIGNLFRDASNVLKGNLRLSQIFTPNRNRKAFKGRLASIYKTYKSNPSKAGYDFETFVRDTLRGTGVSADLATDLKKMGQYPKDLLKGGGDGGFDVICYDQNSIYLIQTKFKGGKNRVKGEDIAKTDVASRLFIKYYQSNGETRNIIPVVMTTGELDNTAKAYAKELNMVIWNNEHLYQMMGNIA